MDTQYRSAGRARSAWWRSTADALGIQHPLVTLRCTPAGGGELITWFADGADAVAALTMALRLPSPAESVRLDVIAPTVAAAIAATYTSAASPPAVALHDGVPAAMVESWPTSAALIAAVVSPAERPSDGVAASATASPVGTPPSPAHRRSSKTTAVVAAAAAVGVVGVAAAAAAAGRSRPRAARRPAEMAAQSSVAAGSSAAAETAEVAAMRRACAVNNQDMAAARALQTASRTTALAGGAFPTHYINGVPSYGGIQF